MNESDLKLCPFCGEKAEIVTSQINDEFGVQCTACLGSTGIALYKEPLCYDSIEEAIASWNTRATHPETRTEGEREALSKHVQNCTHYGACIYDPGCHEHDEFVDGLLDAGYRRTEPIEVEAVEEILKQYLSPYIDKDKQAFYGLRDLLVARLSPAGPRSTGEG